MANGKIDVHTHFVTSTYRKALLEHGYAKPDGMSAIPRWSKESHLAFVDSHAIPRSIIRVSSPGRNITSDRALNQTSTRESNEYAAYVKARYSNQFECFASLPLPDVSASLAEIKHVLDGPLKADGINSLSNTSGLFLGDPCLRLVLAQFYSRNAVLFVHPSTACYSANSEDPSASESPAFSSPLASAYPDPIFENIF